MSESNVIPFPTPAKCDEYLGRDAGKCGQHVAGHIDGRGFCSVHHGQRMAFLGGGA